MRKYFECLGRLEQYLFDFKASPDTYPIVRALVVELETIRKSLYGSTTHEAQAKDQIDRLMQEIFNE